ncbi:MAG TPA: DUF4870 domain-containing protein [Anaerolineales bacterium]|nr:DUF4870 domain-containing protein [Anaerolineales bacterium]
MEIAPTSDEKIMAALAHGSIFLVFFGPVIPVVLWASQRKKSKYVSFHALQAMGYQVLLFWLWILAGFLIAILTMCLVFPLVIFSAKDSSNIEFASFLVQIFIFLSIFGFMGLFFLTGIIGAVFCLVGKDFRYPLIGKWLERYLPYNADSESQMDETREDNWVAGICHATAVLQFWGIVTPLIVWFTQKERSVRLRFQSMQAFIYQGIVLVVYMAGMMLYIVSFFGFFLFFAVGLMGEGGKIQGPVGTIMLIVFVVIIVFWLVINLLMPIYYLLAAFAGVRVIQGRPFHYPIIGGILERRMEKFPTLKPMP